MGRYKPFCVCPLRARNKSLCPFQFRFCTSRKLPFFVVVGSNKSAKFNLGPKGVKQAGSLKAKNSLTPFGTRDRDRDRDSRGQP